MRRRNILKGYVVTSVSPDKVLMSDFLSGRGLKGLGLEWREIKTH